MALQWSPADLGRQRLVVRRIAHHAEVGRRRFDAARSACIATLRTTLGTPLGLIGCFVAGMVLGASRSRRSEFRRVREGTLIGNLLATAFWLVRARAKRPPQSAEPPTAAAPTAPEGAAP
jgi:hypothetical protein